MSANMRHRAEILFRRGNERVEEGSAGTDWETSLDSMVKMLGTGETLIHVAGFQNFGLRGQPATLITLTSKRLIIQLYPGEKPIKLPLKEIAEVSCHRDYLFQNNLHITGTSGLVCKLAMEKDIAAPLERAIKAAQRA